MSVDPDKLVEALEAIRWALDHVASGHTVNVTMTPSTDGSVSVAKSFEIRDARAERQAIVDADPPTTRCHDTQASGDRCTLPRGHLGDHASGNTGEKWPRNDDEPEA